MVFEKPRKFDWNGHETIISAADRYAEVYAKTKDYASIRRIYRDALDDYSREPAKLKALARDYWKFVKDANDEVRKATCRDMERSFEKHVETKSDGIFEVQSQTTAARVVVQCWREAGDTEHADRLEKETAKCLEKATKKTMDSL